MKKFIISAVSAMALLPSQGMTQAYAASGTDYTKAASETWTEDAMNDFLRMANSFACVTKNSRMDLLPNASYEALISEVQCGLADLNSTGTNRDTLTRAVIVSSRASNTSTQEGAAYFDSSSGPKFITSMQFKKGPETFAPYGQWYIGYMMAQLAGTDFTVSNTPIFGFVDIAPGTGTSIVVKGADRDRSQGGTHDYVMRSKISYSDTTLDTATMVGQYVGVDENNATVDTVVAGRTSETNYFRVTIDDVANTTSSQCFKRDQTWSNVYKYDVYNKASGAKLNLSGSFGFKTAANVRGFYDHNGAWFDSGAFAFNDSSNKTVAVTDNETSTAYTLKWAPGKLFGISTVQETLAAGDNLFRRYTNTGEYDVKINVAGSTYEMRYYNMSSGALITDPWDDAGRGDAITIGTVVDSTDIARSGWDHLGWVTDVAKRQEVYWGGGATVNAQVRTPKSLDATLLAANFTALTQDGDGGVKNMPLDRASWAAGSEEATRAYATGTGSTANGDAFYFTGLNPTGVAAGLLPRTLYIDTGTSGPDASDKPVMFDFAVNERSGEYEDFSDDSTAAFSNNSWPQYDINLVDGSSNKYRWNFGAYPWDHSIAAVKADSTVKSVDLPVMLKYEHTTAKDVNAAQDTNGITYFAHKNNYFPDKANLCGSALGSTHYSCTAKPSSFNGKTFMLEYNGSHLHGLPEQKATFTDGGDQGYYIKIVNPIDASDVTAADGTVYILKARAIGKTFVPALTSVYNPASPVYYDPNVASTADCDDLSFDTLSDLGSGWAKTDLPNVNDTTTYPQTTKTWSDLPAASTLKCTVTMGKATGC